MIRFRHLYFFVATLCAFSFTSCENNDDAEPSQQALLTAGEWEGAAVYFGGADSTAFFRNSVGFEVNNFSYRFDDNGEYRQIFANSPTTLGTWEFAGTDQEEIIFDRGETYESRATINELSTTELHLESNRWFGPQNPPVEIRFTQP